jgi:hypothetical protein
MKTKVVYYLATKIVVVLVLVAVLVVKTTASEAPKLKLVPHSGEKAIVVVDNSTDSYAELTIEDAKGDVLYYRDGRITEKMYSKIFDFKNLTDGDYKIIVKNKAGKKELNFFVSNNKVIVEPEKMAVMPYFFVENDVIKISYLNESMNRVALTLTSQNGEIYKKWLGNDFSIHRAFNISSLNKGEYAATISDGSNTFSFNFEK